MKPTLRPCAHCGVSTRRECIVCRRPTCVQGGWQNGEAWVCLECRPAATEQPGFAEDRPAPPPPPRPVVITDAQLDARARQVLDDERMAFARGARGRR